MSSRNINSTKKKKKKKIIMMIISPHNGFLGHLKLKMNICAQIAISSSVFWSGSRKLYAFIYSTNGAMIQCIKNFINK